MKISEYEIQAKVNLTFTTHTLSQSLYLELRSRNLSCFPIRVPNKTNGSFHASNA